MAAHLGCLTVHGVEDGAWAGHTPAPATPKPALESSLDGTLNGDGVGDAEDDKEQQQWHHPPPPPHASPPPPQYALPALSLDELWTELLALGGAGAGGRGLHSFPFQLNLSSSVHRITQLNS